APSDAFRLAEDDDVERVINRNAVVVPRLGEEMARRVEAARAGPALAAAAAGTGGGLAALVACISGVATAREDRLAGNGAADVEDVSPRARVCGQRNTAGLRRDAAVRAYERPLDRRRTGRAGGSGGSGGTCRAGRSGSSGRAGRATRELAGLEVARQKRTVLHLHGCDAVTRQRFARRVTGAAEHEQQCHASDHHRGRRRESLQQTHVEFPLVVGDLKPLTLGSGF